jgi:hypothetical protein
VLKGWEDAIHILVSSLLLLSQRRRKRNLSSRTPCCERTIQYIGSREYSVEKRHTTSDAHTLRFPPIDPCKSLATPTCCGEIAGTASRNLYLEQSRARDIGPFGSSPPTSGRVEGNFRLREELPSFPFDHLSTATGDVLHDTCAELFPASSSKS